MDIFTIRQLCFVWEKRPALVTLCSCLAIMFVKAMNVKPSRYHNVLLGGGYAYPSEK